MTAGNNPHNGRDSKLMSVLAARRHALVGRGKGRHTTPLVQEQDNSTQEQLSQRSECEKNCTSNFTTRATAGCMRKCAVQYKVIINPTSNISSRHPVTDNRVTNSLGDELLDTEESQTNGLYYVSPNTRNRYAPSVLETKDPNNTLNYRNSYKHNVIDNDVRQSSTEKIYLKLLRTTMDARQKRVDPSRHLRQRIPATTPGTERSVEDSDLAPYIFFGQKLTSLKVNDSKNFVTPVVSSSTRSSTKSSNDENIVAKSVGSIERNKFRRFNPQTRNIVALSRKYGGVIPKALIDGSSSTTTHSPVSIISDEGIKDKTDEVSELSASISKDLEEELLNKTFVPIEHQSVIKKDKVEFEALKGVIPVENKEIENLTKIPKIPGITKNETKSMEAENTIKTSETVLLITERSITTSTITSPTITPEVVSSTEVSSIFTPENTSAASQLNRAEQNTTLAVSTLKPDLTTSAVTASTVTPQKEFTTPKLNYTIHHPDETRNIIFFIPRTDLLPENKNESKPDQNETTTVISDAPKTFTRTTVSSSVRSTVNSNNLTNSRPTAVQIAEVEPMTPPPSTTLVPFLTTSVLPSPPSPNTTYFNLSSIFPNFSGVNSNIPALPDLTLILSPSSSSQSTKKPPILSDGVLLSQNNDVTIEMHRMNMATYVLAGLGMFPIVLIAIFVVRSFLFRRETKNDNGLDNYHPDNHKPISPVVKLEDSCQSSCYGEDSIMTEQTFNRNQLKFKSLLGEGNFGQVWKAEADDLAGHIGTTRIVAVKTERCGNTHGGLRDEAEIMKKLGSHPNVVTLLGACTEKGNYMEYK